MSNRLETLQVAKLSPQLLGDSADLVADFLLGQLSEDGGFRGRAGDEGDLYYTVFGLDGLNALSAELPQKRVMPFLLQFGSGEDLDLIHLACLIRCWTALGLPDGGPGPEILRPRLDDFRHQDGGWGVDADGTRGTTYATFLAISACQDLGLSVPDAPAAVEFLQQRQTPEGGFAPDAQLAVATTPTTAAGVAALRQLEAHPDPKAARWLEAMLHEQGGFLPAHGAPMPDLLSTAVALHALSSLGASLAELAEPVLDFVDTLWTSKGAFHGHWADEVLDCEYTFYGLLALGHLSVWSR